MSKLISKIKNFGPITSAELNSIGITTLEQIEKLGFEETCRKYVQFYPERLNANAFIGILCAIEGMVWTKATIAQRMRAKNLVLSLKLEFGVRPYREQKHTRQRKSK